MKITVITVCLNSEKTIEKTIKSVIMQNRQGWELEYIVVDGASSDGTMSVIKKYSDSIARCMSEPDRGIYDAMNKGIGMASGDVITFLNSDDWYEENALNSVMEVFADGSCDCVYCDNYVIRKNGKKEYFDASQHSIDDLHIQMIYFHSSIFCRKEFFKKIGNFDLRYKMAADYDWFLYTIENGARLRYLHWPVFTFCYGGISSVNEIECAGEARRIALRHLPSDEEMYKDRIDERFREFVLFVPNKEVLSPKLTRLFGRYQINILWGAGERGTRCVEWFQKLDIRVDAVVDSNSSLWGSFIGKIPVCSPDILDKKSCNLVITTNKYADEIRNTLNSKKNDNICVFELNALCVMLAD